MTHETLHSIADYDYSLPRDLIAQQPLSKRDDARLMVVDRRNESIDHWHVRDLPDLLASDDCLVMNDSRVVAARLIGLRTKTGGRWEGLFLSLEKDGSWKILAKSRGKMAAGETVTLLDHEAREASRLKLIERHADGIWTARPEPAEEVMTLLDRVGRVPLPFYVRGGDMLPSDRHQYQTVYARHPGSVAAPTAGLHLTKNLLAKLTERGVGATCVTLHVGLDTFRPITADSIQQHAMHSEWAELTSQAASTIEARRQAGGRVVAVGTTSVRVLETAAAAQEGRLKAYPTTTKDASHGRATPHHGGVSGPTLMPFRDQTDLFIRPPYAFRAVDALMTNFHLPRTTLLVLVRTFGGDSLIRRAYDEAICQQYRFYSYGDAMLIL